MNIQLEINGEPYTGSAFKTNDGLLIHLPGIQAASAPPFETLFQGVPENKLNGGNLEVGEWNGKEFSFESQVTFGIGVVACATVGCTVDELIRSADDLMYEAKRGGKDSIRDPSVQDAAQQLADALDCPSRTV